MYSPRIRQADEVAKRSQLLLSVWQDPDFRVWTRAIALLVTLTFVLPFLTWAFNRGTYASKAQTVQYLNQLVEIPKQYGRVMHAFQGGDRLVVHIQDLHCNYEVQKHIAKIIDYLAGRHNLRLVALEGASRPVDVSKLSTFPVKNVKQEVGDYFLRQGKISGAEFYAALGRHKIDLVGIEDAEQYKAGRETVMTFLNNESLGYVWDLREILDELKPTIYSRQLIAFDAKTSGFRNGELSLFKYCRFLYKAAKRRRLDLQAYPQLTRYANSHSELFSSAVDPDQLYLEIDELDHHLRTLLYTHADQESLDQLCHRLDIMEKMLNISVSNKEFAEYRAQPYLFKINTFQTFIRNHDQAGEMVLDPEVYGLEQYLKQVEAFYANADLRSQGFVRNLLERMDQRKTSIAVLVSGGYHTQHVIDLLRMQNVSYVSLKAALSRVDVVNPYFSLLQKKRTPLEKLLAQNQNIINLPPGHLDPVFQDQTDVSLKACLGFELKDLSLRQFKSRFGQAISRYTANTKRFVADLDQVVKGRKTLIMPFTGVPLVVAFYPKQKQALMPKNSLTRMTFKRAELAFYPRQAGDSDKTESLEQLEASLRKMEREGEIVEILQSRLLKWLVMAGLMMAFSGAWLKRMLSKASLDFPALTAKLKPVFFRNDGSVKPVFQMSVDSSRGAIGRHAIREVQPLGANRLRVLANPYTRKGVVDESVEWEFAVTLAPLSGQMAADWRNDLELFSTIAQQKDGLSGQDQQVMEQINARARAMAPRTDAKLDLQKDFQGMYVIEDVTVVRGPSNAVLAGLSWKSAAAVDQNLMRYAPARVRRAALLHELGEGIADHAYLRGSGKRARAAMKAITPEQMGFGARALGPEAQDGLTDWLEALKQGILISEHAFIPRATEDDILEYIAALQETAEARGLRVQMNLSAATPEQAEALEALGLSGSESTRDQALSTVNNSDLQRELAAAIDVKAPANWRMYSEIAVTAEPPFVFNGKRTLVLQVKSKQFIRRMQGRQGKLPLTVEDVRQALHKGELCLAKWNLPLVFSHTNVAQDEATWLITENELREQQAAWQEARQPRPEKKAETQKRMPRTEQQAAEDERAAQQAAEKEAKEEAARVFSRELRSLAENELQRLLDHPLTQALQDKDRMTQYHELLNRLKRMRMQVQREAKQMKLKRQAMVWKQIDYRSLMNNFNKILRSMLKGPKGLTPRQVNTLLGRLQRYEEIVRQYLFGMVGYHHITYMSGGSVSDPRLYNEVSNQVILHASVVSAANKRLMTLCTEHLLRLEKSPQMYKTKVQKAEKSGEPMQSVEQVQDRLQNVRESLEGMFGFYVRLQDRMPALFATLGQAYGEMAEAARDIQTGSYTQAQLREAVFDFYVELSALVAYDFHFYWMEGNERPATEYNQMIRHVVETSSGVFQAMGWENIDVKEYFNIRGDYEVLSTSEQQFKLRAHGQSILGDDEIGGLNYAGLKLEQGLEQQELKGWHNRPFVVRASKSSDDQLGKVVIDRKEVAIYRGGQRYSFEYKPIDQETMQGYQLNYYGVGGKWDDSSGTSDIAAYAEKDTARASQLNLWGITINKYCGLRNQGLLRPLLNLFFHLYPGVERTHPNMRNLLLQDMLIRKYGFGPEEDVEPNVWMRRLPKGEPGDTAVRAQVFFENEAAREWFQKFPPYLKEQYEIVSAKSADFLPLYLGTPLVVKDRQLFADAQTLAPVSVKQAYQGPGGIMPWLKAVFVKLGMQPTTYDLGVAWLVENSLSLTIGGVVAVMAGAALGLDVSQMLNLGYVLAWPIFFGLHYIKANGERAPPKRIWIPAAFIAIVNSALLFTPLSLHMMYAASFIIHFFVNQVLSRTEISFSKVLKEAFLQANGKIKPAFHFLMAGIFSLGIGAFMIWGSVGIVPGALMIGAVMLVAVGLSYVPPGRIEIQELEWAGFGKISIPVFTMQMSSEEKPGGRTDPEPKAIKIVLDARSEANKEPVWTSLKITDWVNEFKASSISEPVNWKELQKTSPATRREVFLNCLEEDFYKAIKNFKNFQADFSHIKFISRDLIHDLNNFISVLSIEFDRFTSKNEEYEKSATKILNLFVKFKSIWKWDTNYLLKISEAEDIDKRRNILNGYIQSLAGCQEEHYIKILKIIELHEGMNIPLQKIPDFPQIVDVLIFQAISEQAEALMRTYTEFYNQLINQDKNVSKDKRKEITEFLHMFKILSDYLERSALLGLQAKSSVIDIHTLYLVANELKDIIQKGLPKRVAVELEKPDSEYFEEPRLVKGNLGQFMFGLLKNLVTNGQRAIYRRYEAIREENAEAAERYLKSAKVSVCFKNNMLEVKDTGDGIKPEMADKMFERGETEGLGLGIGLASLKEAAVRYGLKVEYNSIPGKGTTVFVEFSPDIQDINTRLLTNSHIKKILQRGKDSKARRAEIFSRTRPDLFDNQVQEKEPGALPRDLRDSEERTGIQSERISRFKKTPGFQRLYGVIGFTGRGDTLSKQYPMAVHDLRAAEMARRAAEHCGVESEAAEFIALVQDYAALPYRHYTWAGEVGRRLERAGYNEKEMLVKRLREDGFEIPEQLEQDLLNFDNHTTRFLSDPAKIARASKNIVGVVEAVLIGLKERSFGWDDIPDTLKEKKHFAAARQEEFMGRLEQDLNVVVLEIASAILLEPGASADGLLAKARNIADTWEADFLKARQNVSRLGDVIQNVEYQILPLFEIYAEEYATNIKPDITESAEFAVGRLIRLTDHEVNMTAMYITDKDSPKKVVLSDEQRNKLIQTLLDGCQLVSENDAVLLGNRPLAASLMGCAGVVALGGGMGHVSYLKYDEYPTGKVAALNEILKNIKPVLHQDDILLISSTGPGSRKNVKHLETYLREEVGGRYKKKIFIVRNMEWFGLYLRRVDIATNVVIMPDRSVRLIFTSRSFRKYYGSAEYQGDGKWLFRGPGHVGVIDEMFAEVMDIEKKSAKKEAGEKPKKEERFDLAANLWATLGWGAMFVVGFFAFGGLDAGWFAQIWMAIYGTSAVVYGSRWLPGLVAVKFARRIRAGDVKNYLKASKDLKDAIALQFDREVDFAELKETNRRFAKTEEDKIYFTQWLVQNINYKAAKNPWLRRYLAVLQGINRFLRALILPHVLAQEKMRVNKKSNAKIYLNPILPLYYYLSQLLNPFFILVFKLRILRTQAYKEFMRNKKNNKYEIMAGATELLEKFKAAGIPQYIASAANKKELLSQLKEHGISEYFRERIFDINHPKTEAIKKAHAETHKDGIVVMFGDRQMDMIAANEVPDTVGIGLALEPGQSSLNEHGAIGIVRDFSEITWDADTHTLQFINEKTGKEVVIVNVKAVVFDYDGTLEDNQADVLKMCGNIAAELLGAKPGTWKYAQAYALGVSTMESMRVSLRQDGIPRLYYRLQAYGREISRTAPALGLSRIWGRLGFGERAQLRQEIQRRFQTVFSDKFKLSYAALDAFAEGIISGSLTLRHLSRKFTYDLLAWTVRRAYTKEEAEAFGFKGNLYNFMMTFATRLDRSNEIIAAILKNLEKERSGRKLRVLDVGLGLLPFSTQRTNQYLKKAFKDSQPGTTIEVQGMDLIKPQIIVSLPEFGVDGVFNAAGDLVNMVQTSEDTAGEEMYSQRKKIIKLLRKKKDNLLQDESLKSGNADKYVDLESMGIINPWKSPDYLKNGPGLFQDDVFNFKLDKPVDVILSRNIQLQYPVEKWDLARQQIFANLNEGGYYVELANNLCDDVGLYSIYCKKKGRLIHLGPEQISDLDLMSDYFTKMPVMIFNRIIIAQSGFLKVIRELTDFYGPDFDELFLMGDWSKGDLRLLGPDTPIQIGVYKRKLPDRETRQKWEEQFGIQVLEVTDQEQGINIDVPKFALEGETLLGLLLEKFSETLSQQNEPTQVLLCPQTSPEPADYKQTTPSNKEKYNRLLKNVVEASRGVFQAMGRGDIDLEKYFNVPSDHEVVSSSALRTVNRPSFIDPLGKIAVDTWEPSGKGQIIVKGRLYGTNGQILKSRKARVELCVNFARSESGERDRLKQALDAYQKVLREKTDWYGQDKAVLIDIIDALQNLRAASRAPLADELKGFGVITKVEIIRGPPDLVFCGLGLPGAVLLDARLFTASLPVFQAALLHELGVVLNDPNIDHPFLRGLGKRERAKRKRALKPKQAGFVARILGNDAQDGLTAWLAREKRSLEVLWEAEVARQQALSEVQPDLKQLEAELPGASQDLKFKEKLTTLLNKMLNPKGLEPVREPVETLPKPDDYLKGMPSQDEILKMLLKRFPQWHLLENYLDRDIGREGIDSFEHGLEVLFLFWLLHDGEYSEQELLEGIVAASLLDFDIRDPITPPKVANMLLLLKNKDLQDVLDKMDVDVKAIALMIERTDHLWDEKKQSQFDTKLAGIPEAQRQESIKRRAEALQLLDKTARMFTLDPEQNLKRVKAFLKQKLNVVLLPEKILAAQREFYEKVMQPRNAECKGLLEKLPDWARQNWESNCDYYKTAAQEVSAELKPAPGAKAKNPILNPGVAVVFIGALFDLFLLFAKVDFGMGWGTGLSLFLLPYFAYRLPMMIGYFRKSEKDSYELSDFREDLEKLQGLRLKIPDDWNDWINQETDQIPDAIRKINIKTLHQSPWRLLLLGGIPSYYHSKTNTMALHKSYAAKREKKWPNKFMQIIEAWLEYHRLKGVAHELTHYLIAQQAPVPKAWWNKIPGLAWIAEELQVIRVEWNIGATPGEFWISEKIKTLAARWKPFLPEIQIQSPIVWLPLEGTNIRIPEIQSPITIMLAQGRKSRGGGRKVTPKQKQQKKRNYAAKKSAKEFRQAVHDLERDLGQGIVFVELAEPELDIHPNIEEAEQHIKEGLITWEKTYDRIIVRPKDKNFKQYAQMLNQERDAVSGALLNILEEKNEYEIALDGLDAESGKLNRDEALSGITEGKLRCVISDTNVSLKPVGKPAKEYMQVTREEREAVAGQFRELFVEQGVTLALDLDEAEAAKIEKFEQLGFPNTEEAREAIEQGALRHSVSKDGTVWLMFAGISPKDFYETLHQKRTKKAEEFRKQLSEDQVYVDLESDTEGVKYTGCNRPNVAEVSEGIMSGKLDWKPGTEPGGVIVYAIDMATTYYFKEVQEKREADAKEFEDSIKPGQVYAKIAGVEEKELSERIGWPNIIEAPRHIRQGRLVYIAKDGSRQLGMIGQPSKYFNLLEQERNELEKEFNSAVPNEGLVFVEISNVGEKEKEEGIRPNIFEVVKDIRGGRVIPDISNRRIAIQVIGMNPAKYIRNIDTIRRKSADGFLKLFMESPMKDIQEGKIRGTVPGDQKRAEAIIEIFGFANHRIESYHAIRQGRMIWSYENKVLVRYVVGIRIEAFVEELIVSRQDMADKMLWSRLANGLESIEVMERPTEQILADKTAEPVAKKGKALKKRMSRAEAEKLKKKKREKKEVESLSLYEAYRKIMTGLAVPRELPNNQMQLEPVDLSRSELLQSVKDERENPTVIQIHNFLADKSNEVIIGEVVLTQAEIIQGLALGALQVMDTEPMIVKTAPELPEDKYLADLKYERVTRTKLPLGDELGRSLAAFLKRRFAGQSALAFADLGAGPRAEFGRNLRSLLGQLGFKVSLGISVEQGIIDRSAPEELLVQYANIHDPGELAAVGINPQALDLVSLNNIDNNDLIAPALGLVKPGGVLTITHAYTEEQDFIANTRRRVGELAAADPTLTWAEIDLPPDYPASNLESGTPMASMPKMFVLARNVETRKRGAQGPAAGSAQAEADDAQGPGDGLLRQLRADKALGVEPGIGVNRPLLKQSIRLLQVWRAPRISWMFILYSGFSVLNRLALTMPGLRGPVSSEQGKSGKKVEIMKRVFPRDDIESREFNPRMIEIKALAGRAGLSEIIGGRYAERDDARVGLDIPRALLGAIEGDHGNSRLLRWRQKLAAALVLHMLRYRSAEYYQLTAGQQLADQLREFWWTWTSVQPADLQRFIHGRVQAVNPEGYLSWMQSELAAEMPELATASTLAQALRQADTELGQAYLALASRPNARAQLAFGEAVRKMIRDLPEPEQRMTELFYFSELLKRLPTVRTREVADWRAPQAPPGDVTTRTLVWPQENVLRPRTLGGLADLLRPLPLVIRDDIRELLYRKPFRSRPAGAA